MALIECGLDLTWISSKSVASYYALCPISLFVAVMILEKENLKKNDNKSLENSNLTITICGIAE